MVSKYPSTKRFGPRYGRSVKNKIGAVDEARRASKKCPYCRHDGIKRLSAGIWVCTKPTCNSKFTGRSYSVSAKRVVV